MRACVFLLAALTASGQTGSLAYAARGGKTKLVEAFLAGGAEIESRDQDGRTPLMLAAQYGWNAYMLALFSPAGGVIHTTHDGVLRVLPPPKRIRLALNAA